MDDENKELRCHVWQYFELHAQQRMSMLNNYLVMTGLVAAGLAACLQGKDLLGLLGTILGAFLSLVAFAFWKLDERTSFLTKQAEDAMKILEAPFPVAAAKIFTAEALRTKASGQGSPSTRIWTYGSSLRLIFLLTGLTGLGGGSLSLCRYLGIVT